MAIKIPVEVRIMGIDCRKTDNITSSDQIYYRNSIKCSERPRTTQVEVPMPKLAEDQIPSSQMTINSGALRQTFPPSSPLPPFAIDENIVFSGNCELSETTRQSVNGTIYFFDREGTPIDNGVILGPFIKEFYTGKTVKDLFAIAFYFLPVIGFFTLNRILGAEDAFLYLIFAPITFPLGLIFSLGLAFYATRIAITLFNFDDNFLGGCPLNLNIEENQVYNLSYTLSGSTGLTTESGKTFAASRRFGLGFPDYTVYIRVTMGEAFE